MCFDVPKVVRSPEYDHGHDEESRNGRDVKTDILDDYIRTSERFRVIRVFFGVPESYRNTGNKYWASWPSGEREEVGRDSFYCYGKGISPEIRSSVSQYLVQYRYRQVSLLVP